MATEIPQRALRNETGRLLKRVERGERLRITVHGHPVADLVPIEDRPTRRTFVPVEELRREMAGLLEPDDGLAEQLKAFRGAGDDRYPFGAFED
jgi:prevent-host-death family protein